MSRWEAMWQAGETPWDKGAAAPPLVEYLAAGGGELRAATHILVPGCGSGHDVRAVAAEGLRVTGLDLSATAVEKALTIPPVGNEGYLCGNIFEDGWHAGQRFDAVWEHTCFCAIDPADRPRYARAVADLLPPGGHLVGVFYLNPYDPGEEATGPPFESTPEGIRAVLAPWFDFVSGQVPQTAYPGREGREWLAIFRRRGEGEVALA